jgi:1-acyl-sn-glycerol-3-phosphate acyltransferase
MPKWKRRLLATFFFPLVAATLLLSNLLQTCTLVVAPVFPRLFRAANRRISSAWFFLLSWSIEVPLGVEIVLSGDAIPWRENAVVMANHQAMSDIPVLVAVAHRAGRKGDLKWFVKKQLKWVPGIGWGLQFLDCLFVRRNWTADKTSVLATFEKIRKHRSPFWVVSFLEGTRLTAAKLARSQAYGQKQGLPVLRHVMLPRTKGFQATLEGLGHQTQAVYDLTIVYEGAVPSLLGLFFGPLERVHVHARRYTQWPRENVDQWVVERFREKDELLERFRRTGSF